MKGYSVKEISQTNSVRKSILKITYLNKRSSKFHIVIFTNRNGTHLCFLARVILTGFITSLTAVNYFINPQVSMPVINVILILIGAVLLAIVSLLLIKSVTAFFTKIVRIQI